MKTSRFFGSVALVVLVATAASCSDEDKGDDSISKADFVTQANALCATFDGKIEAAQATVVTEDDQVALISNVLVPELRNTLTSIRGLGFPEGDEALIGGLIDQTEDKLDEVAADPASLLNSDVDPFAEINAQLVDYGLVECGN